MRPLIIAALLGLAAMTAALQAQPAASDWPSYGRDRGAQHYSPLAQITPANVGNLKVAWTHHMLAGAPPPPAGGRGRAISSETTPLVIDGILYLGSPAGRIVALDGATGRELWSYAIPGNARPSSRGLEYWQGEPGHDP
jgi:quinoprotein glucose dehydrogenase